MSAPRLSPDVRAALARRVAYDLERAERKLRRVERRAGYLRTYAADLRLQLADAGFAHCMCGRVFERPESDRSVLGQTGFCSAQCHYLFCSGQPLPKGGPDWPARGPVVARFEVAR